MPRRVETESSVIHGKQGEDFEGRRGMNPERSEPDPIPVVRIIPLTFKSVQKLRDELDSGQKIDDIELTRVVMSVKSSSSTTSYGMTMPLGGKMEPGETFLAAARRRIRGESMLYPMGGHWWEDRPLFRPIDGSYTYSILGQERTTESPPEPRFVTILPYPVLPPEYTRLHLKPNPKKDKIASFESFTPSELNVLIRHGEVDRLRDETGPLGEALTTFDLAGHFSVAAKYDIEIEPAEAQKKNRVLENLLERVDDFEWQTRSAVLSEIQSERVLRSEASVPSLTNCRPDEIIRAFERVHIFWLLRDEKSREASGVRRPPPGLDLLKFAWFMSGEGIEPKDMVSLLFESPTDHIRKTVRSVVLSLRRAVLTVEQKRLEAEHGPDQANSLMKAVKLDTMLELVRSRFGKMAPLGRFEYLRELDAIFVREFAKHLGTTPEAIWEVKPKIDRFFYSMVDQSLQANPKFARMHQPSKPFNEIMNSEVARLILISLGVNPLSPSDRITDDRLRRQFTYEATRHLGFIVRGVESHKRYMELLRNGNAPIEAIMDSLFTPPDHEEVRHAGDRTYTVLHRRTRFRVDGEEQHVFVDEKPPKDFESFLRKSLLEPLDEIYDVFSRNIVLVANEDIEHGEETSRTAESFADLLKKRIRVANTIKNSIKRHFVDICTDSGWRIEFIGEKDSFAQLGKSPDMLRIEEAKGKRPGSKGRNIIRTKFYAVLTDGRGREYAEEIIIYPFDNFIDTPYHGVLWGIDEKVEDDARGGYSFRRLTQPDPDNPDLPSLYVIMHPPHLYGQQADALFAEDDTNGTSENAPDNSLNDSHL